MYLDVFDRNDFGTNCWLLAAEGSAEAVVIDPGFSPEGVRAMLARAGKRPVAVLATHGHFDHVGSAGEFCGDDLPLYIHEADRMALDDPRAWGSGFPVPPAPVKDVRTVQGGDRLDSIGRSDLPNSSPADMEKSLRRFLMLPDPLPVYPGHGPETTVGQERRTNPFLVELG